MLCDGGQENDETTEEACVCVKRMAARSKVVGDREIIFIRRMNEREKVRGTRHGGYFLSPM